MMENSPSARFAVALGACVFAPSAFAYVGPGAGLGVLGAMLAILAAVLATVSKTLPWQPFQKHCRGGNIRKRYRCTEI
jgi:hypothetical protein